MEKQNTGLFGKLKKRWGVDSNFQVIMILLVFACTGTSVMFVKPFLYGLLGVPEGLELWKRIGIWFLVVFPAYQVLLLFYGTVFGQFRFFWEFELRMWRRMFFIKNKEAKKS